MPVSDGWMQRVGVHVDDSEIELVGDLHNQIDLGERCFIVFDQIYTLAQEQT